jgi:hypothetical protein
LHNNIFYNGPRAAFNFNDGFGGGDDIAGNLLLNCVRESSDHGPWNSWSRVPYITNIRTGKPSIIPATRKIHGNFILATYFSQQAIDTDDGSAYYEVFDNFFVYGDNGLKSDFGGHDNKWHNNVLAFVGNCYHMGSFKGYNDAFFSNQCIFRWWGGCLGCPTGSSAGLAIHMAAIAGCLLDGRYMITKFFLRTEDCKFVEWILTSTLQKVTITVRPLLHGLPTAKSLLWGKRFSA